MRALILGLIVVVASLDALPAHACSPPEEIDVSFRLSSAPVGGVWWVRNVDTRFATNEIVLVDEAGNEVVTPIVSIGAQGTAAIRVPDVAVGTRFTLSPDVGFDPFADGTLVVTAGTPANENDPPAPPSIRVEQRDTRVGYVGILTIPWPMCTAGGEWGLWNYHFDERPFLLVEDPGDDVVLDVQLQPLDEEPFADVDSANEVLFDGRVAAALDEGINAPPETETAEAFNVHARVRRIADGIASDVVTIEVAQDDIPPEERLSWACGCGSTPSTTVAPFALALIALRAARRRR